MRKVYCVRCGRQINEGESAVMHKYFTGFYCSFKCLALEAGIAEEKFGNEYAKDYLLG